MSDKTCLLEPQQGEMSLSGFADPNEQLDLIPISREDAGLRPRRIFTPFDYQLEAKVAFDRWYANPDEPEALLALATGLGKTVTACLCLQVPLAQKQKILWITHRNELLNQSAGALGDVLGVHVGVEKAERRASYRDAVIIASIQTLKGARLERFARSFTPDIIVFDEAHHSVARTWMRLKMVYSAAKVLNLTATPYRSDIGQRLALGTVLIERNTTDGIKGGYLVPPNQVGTIKLNLGGVKVALGDYAPDSLSELMVSPNVLRECVRAVKANLEGRRCIVFAATVAHGQTLAWAFKESGIERVYEVFGETPIPERENIYAAVKANANSILINNLVLTEGLDLPALDFVAIFRPTKNAGLFLQCLGRGLRTNKETGKVDCLVIDAIDARKRAVGQSDLVLPTESDQQKEAALTGKVTSKLVLFLSWFYHTSDIEASFLAKGKMDEHARKRIATAQEIFFALAPELEGKWLPTQLRNRGQLQSILSKSEDTEGALQELARLTGTRHIEAFVKVLQDNDWRYYPHRMLPKTAEQDAGLKAYVDELVDEGDEFTAETVTLNAIAELVPDLKNFMLNVLAEANLAKQAASYYANFLVEGQLIAWFRPVNHSGAGFFYIQQRDAATRLNKFWVRLNTTGQVLRIDVNERVMTYRYSEQPVLPELPTFVKDTAWANQRMTDAQKPHVRGILGIAETDLNGMNISKLSASALMSNHFGDRTLQRIARSLPRAIEAYAQKRDTVL